MKSSGRTTIVFLILIIVMLVSGVAISLYLLQKETQGRKTAEASLEELRDRSMKVEAALKEAQKQVEILKGKNKDADDKINGLLEELDVEKGLREEIKTENKQLKEALEAENKAKAELRQKYIAELEASVAKLKDAEEKLSGHQKEKADLQAKIDELQKRLDNQAAGQVRSETVPPPDTSMQEKVNLDRIVVTPDSAKEGRVLNVDVETEFLIFDLGAKHGMKPGDIMSVYRGKTYLGDVKVSRVQDEMSAADFIPPFSSRKVRKNDQVVPKR